MYSLSKVSPLKVMASALPAVSLLNLRGSDLWEGGTTRWPAVPLPCLDLLLRTPVVPPSVLSQVVVV